METATEEKPLTELLLEFLVDFLGVKEVYKLPGLFVHKVDETWTIKLNGHPKEIDGVQPYHWYIEFNGWPGGIIDVVTGDGVFCAGEAGNEENFRAAILKAMGK